MGVSERISKTIRRTLTPVSAKENAHADLASQEALRPLIQPTPRPSLLASSVTTQLHSITVFRALRRALPGSFSEPESVILPKTHLRPHSQPIDGCNKAHRKPDQAPNERCDQLGPGPTLEGARHRE